MLVLSFLLCACSPKYDWRTVKNTEAGFSILLPAKPASLTRELRIGTLPLRMHMTAADVGTTHFAIAYVDVGEGIQVMTALAAMKAGMVGNIGGTITSEKNGAVNDLVAQGHLQNGQTVLLVARYVVRGQRIYQIIAIGSEKQLTPDVLETFLNSFKG